LNALIQNTLEGYLSFLIRDKQIQLLTEWSMETVLVQADYLELQRVVNNLIQNAVHHTPAQGRIWLKTERLAQDKVRFQVIDSGKGMSPEQLKSVFERFGGQSRTLRHVGTGLGLYLSAQIIKAHSAQLSVENNANGGCVFTVELPLLV
jgi:signal transduction histidine kinase